MADLVLLVNPAAGRGTAARAAGAATAWLRRVGYRVEVLAGRDAGEAARLAADAVARGPAALVVVGGDGIVHQCLPAVAGSRVPLGVVAAGAGNDFARALQLPRRDPEAAAAVVAAGRARHVDLGRSDGTWFATVVAAGFDARVSERAERLSWPRGRLRYDLAALVELGMLRPRRYVLEVDGVVHELDALLVAVANAPTYGGGMRVAPQASVHDGVLDVLVVGAMGRLAFARAFPRVYRGTHVRHPAVRVLRGRRVRLSAADVVAWADGERLGPLPREFDAVPGAVRVLAGTQVAGAPRR